MRLTTSLLALLLVPCLAAAQQSAPQANLPPRGFVPDSANCGRSVDSAVRGERDQSSTTVRGDTKGQCMDCYRDSPRDHLPSLGWQSN